MGKCTEEEILDRIRYHEPSDLGVEKLAQLESEAQRFLEAITEICPDGRELALAMTNAEQAKMWAAKAIALVYRR